MLTIATAVNLVRNLCFGEVPVPRPSFRGQTKKLC